jgi:hypothetical protein
MVATPTSLIPPFNKPKSTSAGSVIAWTWPTILGRAGDGHLRVRRYIPIPWMLVAPECARRSNVIPPGRSGARAFATSVSQFASSRSPWPHGTESPIVTIRNDNFGESLSSVYSMVTGAAKSGWRPSSLVAIQRKA